MIDESDIVLGISNGAIITKLDFQKIENNDISDFIVYIKRQYEIYSEREHNGYSFRTLANIMISSNQSHKITFDMNLDNNLVDVNGVKISKVSIPTQLGDTELKIDQSSYSNATIAIIDKEEIRIPDVDKPLYLRENKVTNCSVAEYENLQVIINHNTKEVNIRIENGFMINPFTIKRLETYKRIIMHFTVEEDIVSELNHIISASYALEKYLKSNGLYSTKYNKAPIINFFYKVYCEKITFDNINNNLARYQIGEYFFILYKNSEKIYILQDIPVTTVIIPNGLEFEGYTLLFYNVVNDLFRKCYTFDYISALKKDKEKLSKEYLDEFVSMIIFNYLLIYWEYNQSSEMINELIEIVTERVKNTLVVQLTINYIQAKKVVGFDYTEEEVNYLIKGTQHDDNRFLVLCCYVLLDRKLESKKLYNLLFEDEKKQFDTWPIKYLYEKL